MQKTTKEKNTSRLTIRISERLREELEIAAEIKGDTINKEVINRLEATQTLDLLHKLLEENASLRSMITEMHAIATGK